MEIDTTLKPKESVKIDCKRITSLSEVILILDSLDLNMFKDAPHYEKLKHLIIENQTT